MPANDCAPTTHCCKGQKGKEPSLEVYLDSTLSPITATTDVLQNPTNSDVSSLFKTLIPVGNETWHGLSCHLSHIHDLDVPIHRVDSGKIDSAHLTELLVRG
jgi:hypothetical protein